ncbi:hypothetical protein ANN_05289 [Periplaneta americana]|uniref:Reverse transcriptase domain-containing protein n=1 Tax=Periplaneta americana TaxID=6978 RepID=A0ABQ8TCR1_PERAM|nr:hypothetical protein ANN_05289 [Periplaneta americana]
MAGLCEGGNEPPGSSKAIKYAIRKVQDNRQGLELNGLHQVLVYADNVNMLGGNPQTIRENTEILLEASNAIGLKVNPEKTKVRQKERMDFTGQENCKDSSNQNFIVIGRFTNTCSLFMVYNIIHMMSLAFDTGIEALSEVRRHFHSHSWWDCRDFFTNRPLQFIQCMWLLTPSNGPKERSPRARDLTVASDNLSAIACLRADR